MNDCHKCGDPFEGGWDDELCPGCKKEIETIKRDLAFERQLDREELDAAFDNEPLQSDLHDEMREAAQDSLLPEEITEIVGARMSNATGGMYSEEETARLLEGLYADDSDIRDFSAND